MLGYRVFSDTKASCRAVLGEWVTDWLRANPGVQVLEQWVTQSSDREFHCQSITLAFAYDARIVDVPRPTPNPPPGTRSSVCDCNPSRGYICSACKGRIDRRIRRSGGNDA